LANPEIVGPVGIVLALRCIPKTIGATFSVITGLGPVISRGTEQEQITRSSPEMTVGDEPG
jgi:hypothetical protein